MRPTKGKPYARKIRDSGCWSCDRAACRSASLGCTNRDWRRTSLRRQRTSSRLPSWCPRSNLEHRARRAYDRFDDGFRWQFLCDQLLSWKCDGVQRAARSDFHLNERGNVVLAEVLLKVIKNAPIEM